MEGLVKQGICNKRKESVAFFLLEFMHDLSSFYQQRK